MAEQGVRVLARCQLELAQQQRVRLTEVPEAERPAILREFPRQNRPGVRVFVKNGMVASDPEGFAAAAPRCHVFRAGPEPAGPAGET
jgi:hypothetical protein